jgi:SprT protein
MREILTPQDMQQLMRDCIKVTHEWVERCNDEFGIALPKFKVVFALKGTTAGKAHIGRGLIQFNPTLLRENPDAFLLRTPAHEVVHHAAYAKFGMDIDAHGYEWKAMMRKLGLPDTRCHTYDTTNVPTKVGRVKNRIVHPVVASRDGVIRTIGIGKVIEFD